jgi:hypothetical protein
MTFDELVEKVLNDPPFRKQLIKDPHAALQSVGVTATPEMVAALNQVDYASMTKVADLFGRADGIHPDSPLT